MDPLGDRLASAVREARSDRALSVAQLAAVSGVSRAMIGKIERGDVQPTASLLARLSGALGLTLSALIARAEGDQQRLSRRDRQLTWTDPESGYRRRAVSPPGSGLELVEVELPPGAVVTFPAETYAFIRQQILVLDGRLTFAEGDERYELQQGDCLQLGPPRACVFSNAEVQTCRYLVALRTTR